MRVINIVKVDKGNSRCIFRTLLSCSTVILFGFILTCLNVINGDGGRWNIVASAQQCILGQIYRISSVRYAEGL